MRGPARNLLESYLTDRKGLVCCESFSSSLNDVKIGIPQGSVLRPIIYLNDLVKCSNFDTTFYANDSVLTLSYSSTNLV